MLPKNLRPNFVCGFVIKGQETFTPIAVSSLKINQYLSFCHEVSPQAALSPSPGELEHVLKLNRSLDFETANLETLRSKKNSRSDRLSTVTAISNKISDLLSDDCNLLGVKDKLSDLDYALERFREVITTIYVYAIEVWDINVIAEGQTSLS